MSIYSKNSVPDTDLDNTIDRLMKIAHYLVDSRVGIVREVIEKQPDVGSPQFFHYYAYACNTAALGMNENFSHTGGASSLREKAIAKAIGEAVERYCSSIVNIKSLPLTSYSNATFPSIHPSLFALYGKKQYETPGFPWARFTEQTRIRWTVATDPLTKSHYYVPAAMVYVPYIYFDDTAGEPIVQPISTGLSCHWGYDRAAVSGLCETIERDALTLFWQARTKPPHVRIETLDDQNYDLVKRFEDVGDSVTILNITTDVQVPTVMSVLCGKHESSPAMVFAAASALSPRIAIEKSLEELAHTRRYTQLIKLHHPPVEHQPPHHHNIVDQTGHLGYWAQHKHTTFGDFCLASDQRISIDDIKDYSTGCPTKDLTCLCKLIKQAGYQALVAELTTPDISELGMNVVHALIPGFHPLFMGHSSRALGGNRLWTVPQRMGYEGITPDTGDNPFPHPYP